MREIKFNAHYKGKIHMVTEIMWSDGTAYIWPEPEDDNIVSLDEIDLLQFTGLKDKNGNEVFEGDIIREEDGTIWPISFEFFGCTGYDLGVDDEGKFEVVGNVYENPELLK